MTTPIALAAQGAAAAAVGGQAGAGSSKRSSAGAKRGAGPSRIAARRPAPSGRGAGAPAGGAKPAAPKKTSPAKPKPGPPKKDGLTGRGFAKSTLTGGLGKASGGRRVLVAEFVLCIVLIGTTPIVMRKPGANGKLYAPNDFVRLSAVCLLFFVLALASAGPKAARVAGAFGALVTLGTAYNAIGSIQAIGAIFSTSAKTKGAVPTAAAGTTVVDTPTYTPVNLAGNPLQQASGAASTGAGATTA